MRRLVGAVTVLVMLTACGDAEERSAADGTVDVVAAFYPLAEIAARVGGERVEVSDLTPSGVEPHDFELSTDRVDQVLDADLVLYLGQGFQPAVEEVAPRTDGAALDLLADDDIDPHVWLDPRRMQSMVERVRDTLTELDAAGADDYADNADRYLAELSALDAELERGLADCDRDTIVVSHDAFGHLAARYGLEQAAISGLAPDAEPDPARLAELADEVEASGITTIFYETLVSPRVAETLARETGVRTAVLDPIEGISDDDLAAGASYLTVMRENLAALRDALTCR